MSDRNSPLSTSPGTLPLCMSSSVSSPRTHFDSRSSGVWKSTGVVSVTRFATCYTALHAALADPEQVERLGAGVVEAVAHAAPAMPLDVVLEIDAAVGTV